MTARLAFAGVACMRRGEMLFRDLSFDLAPGDALVVRGPNGVGKSSLIRIAAGLLLPAAGQVSAVGARALLAERAALDEERTVAGALDFWAALDGPAGEGVLDALALAHLADVPVRLLSTGQRRRVAFARVVASAAPLWLLDEPANGLDAAAVAILERHVAVHRAAGGIVLVATHQPLALPDAATVTLDVAAC